MKSHNETFKLCIKITDNISCEMNLLNMFSYKSELTAADYYAQSYAHFGKCNAPRQTHLPPKVSHHVQCHIIDAAEAFRVL